MKKVILIAIIVSFGIAPIKAQLLGGTAIEKAAMVNNDSLNAKVQMLLYRTCLDVIGEDTTDISPTIIDKRHKLATNIISSVKNLQDKKNMFVYAVLTNVSVEVTTSSSDNDIQSAINAVFSDLAGVKLED